MKKLILLNILIFSVSADALPNCPSDTSLLWNNCFGTLTYVSGAKYVGEYKDDKKHGQGTYTFTEGASYVGEFKDDNFHGQGTYTHNDGERQTGFFINGEYVPNICEDMGLVKGTEIFGKCVLQLIDDL